MKNFLKENWFKIGLLLILAVGVFIFWTTNNNAGGVSMQSMVVDDTRFKSLTKQKQEIEQSKQNDNTNKIRSLYNQVLSSLPEHDLYCLPSKKSYCNLEGCKDVEVGVFVLLGKNTKGNGLFVARCDNDPCSVYDVKPLQSGVFTTFETKEPHGILFRTSSLDQSFIELVTLGTESFVSNGYCYPKQN